MGPSEPRGTTVTILSHSKTRQGPRPICRFYVAGGSPMRRSLMLLSAGFTVLSSSIASAQGAPHNIILFVPDGLRGGIVSPQTAPAMAEIRDKGVNFKNSHSLFPTFTTANASAMSTGHYLGDAGDFSNTIYTGYPLA